MFEGTVTFNGILSLGGIPASERRLSVKGGTKSAQEVLQINKDQVYRIGPLPSDSTFYRMYDTTITGNYIVVRKETLRTLFDTGSINIISHYERV